MLYNNSYDATDPKSIEEYGQKMLDRSFRDIYEQACLDGNNQVINESRANYAVAHAARSYKGGMGNLIEECFFGYKANSNPEPDFPLAGVELKVTPYKVNSGKYTAKERLVLTMIDYFSVVNELSFESSHLWKKSQLLLLVWYLYQKEHNTLDNIIGFVRLFSPPPADLQIIRSDYNKIIQKIRDGKAHELSEGDTLYLGACTKSATSADRRKQPYSTEPAKPRAFSFKNKYMTYVLNHYIRPGVTTYEPIIKDGSSATEFEKYVVDKISEYKGLDKSALLDRLNIPAEQRKAKNIMSVLAFRMLGVKSNQAEEFEKAAISVKTIRINKNGKIKENMSFPPFKFDELANEEWEDSTFGNMLRETKFFFVVYKENAAGDYLLTGCQFWNMPYNDIETDVKKVWETTRDIVKNGQITISIENNKVKNNFPNQSDDRVSHVRPHGLNRNDMYYLPYGTKLTVKETDGSFDWPDVTKYTKQCFWLNNSYILEQLNDDLK